MERLVIKDKSKFWGKVPIVEKKKCFLKIGFRPLLLFKNVAEDLAELE